MRRVEYRKWTHLPIDQCDRDERNETAQGGFVDADIGMIREETKSNDTVIYMQESKQRYGLDFTEAERILSDRKIIPVLDLKVHLSKTDHWRVDQSRARDIMS